MADEIKDIYDKSLPWHKVQETAKLQPDVTTRFGLDSADVSSFTTTQLLFSTFQSSPNAGNFGLEPEGFVHFVDNGVDALNKVVYLPFFIEEGFVVTSARLQTIINDSLNPSNVQIRLDAVSIYLNPTKSKITTGAFDYYRFSGGTSIRSAFTPTSDGVTYEDVFTYSQIKAMNVQNIGTGATGWNTLVLQQDSSDTVGTDFAGFASFNLIIFGHSSKL